MKLIPFACVVWLTVGCASPLTANRPGAYQFPDAAGMHDPVLVLTATNTFAFVDEDGGPWANHGTVTTKGRTLVLRYEATECCQFADVTWEELVILEQRTDGVRVRFRGAEHWLHRLPR